MGPSSLLAIRKPMRKQWLGLLLLAALPACAPDDPDFTVIVGGTVIDCINATLIEDAVIVINDAHIRQVGPRAETPIPSGARIIDASGKFVIPGLADMHNHLGSGSFRFDETPDYERNLARLLAWGFTTVFNQGVPNLEISADLRRVVEHEAHRFPHYFGVGVRFAAGEGHGSSFGAYTPETPEQARAAVQELKTAGVDAVKFVLDDLSYVTTKLRPKLQPDVVAAIIEEAHRHELKVYAHAPILSDAKDVLRAGVDGLIHGVISDPVDEEFVALMKKNQALYITTHAIFEAAADTSDWARRQYDFNERGWASQEELDYGMSPERVRQWESRFDRLATMKAKLPILRANLKTISDAGVLIVLGSDTASVGTGSGVLLGLASHLELELMNDAGLTPAEALRAATINAARMIGREKDMGSVEQGKLADMVILDSNPLADIRNVRSIHRVIKGGVVHDPDALLGGLE